MPINPVVPKKHVLEGTPSAKSRYQLSNLHDYVVSIVIALGDSLFFAGVLLGPAHLFIQRSAGDRRMLCP